MKTKRIIGIIVMILCLAGAIFSGVVFVHEYYDAKNSIEQFEDLSDLIADVDKSALEQAVADVNGEDGSAQELTAEELAELEAALAKERYNALYAENTDFVGWICIDGTNINYPVMQSPNSPNFYLKHNFEKSYSDYGVPYIDEDCVIGESNNYVIYGHHMKNGTMFSTLCKYTSADFYREHPTFQFDTMTSFGTYQIVAVFRFDTNNDTFRYNQYTQMDEEQFAAFMDNVHARQIYETGVDAEFGDQLLTLSTCEYSYANGRFVVVAKKI